MRVLRFDRLDAVGDYDAVWAAASLLHVPGAGLPAVLDRVARALKPGGWHFASYKAAGVEGRDRFGRLFNHPTPEALAAIYRASGAWREVAVERYVGGGYDGVQGPWAAVIARRA